MATNYNIQMKRFNGVDWDSLFPKTSWANISDKPAWIGANKPSYSAGEINDGYEGTVDLTLDFLINEVLTLANFYQVNTKTASYTCTFNDRNKTIVMNSSSATTLTIPAQSVLNFGIGTEITVIRRGSGDVTIAVNSDTLLSEGSKRKINAQYQAVTVKKIASATWIIIGALKT